MLDYIRKLWKIEDLRKKILYTFGMLILFRLVGCIPAPGIDLSRLGMNESNLPLLDIMNMMTGGQMSLTTMEGQKTATSVYGRDCSVTGFPIRFPEMVAREFPNAAYAARGTVTTPANINKLKGYIKNALQAQMYHEGYSVVEVLSPCPINWGLTPVNAMKRIEDELIPYYPLGEFKKRGEKK